MRNPKRIPKILKKIEELWKANPDQRLGQLLINFADFPDSIGLWNVEDDIVERRLKEF